MATSLFLPTATEGRTPPSSGGLRIPGLRRSLSRLVRCLAAAGSPSSRSHGDRLLTASGSGCLRPIRSRASAVALAHVLLLAIFLVPFIALPTPAQALDYVVSPSGSDVSPGSRDKPWRTLARALEDAGPGDTVFVRGGLYPERLVFTRSGNAGQGPITFRAFPGEIPIIDGATLEVPEDDTHAALIAIIDQSYIIVEGFELRNYYTDQKDRTPTGILVTGAATNIQLLENHIHHLGTRWSGKQGGNAHGIAVYGTHARLPLRNLAIRGNTLNDLQLGSSEALVINGNVERFNISGNFVHNCDNIGIDCIGFEGVCPDPGFDFAREGRIAGNRVHHIDASTNPAYGGRTATNGRAGGGGERSAGGIYIDGGARILIEGNSVYQCNIGIELASENAGRNTTGVIVRSNLVYHNHIGGLFIGGYDEKRGGAEECRVVNNTFYQNDTQGEGNGEILLQHHTGGLTIANNILSAGRQGYLLVSPYAHRAPHAVDYNLYWFLNPQQDEVPFWQWAGQEYEKWETYRSESGNDAHSLFAQPGFADPANGDFTLTPASPAIEGGYPAAAAQPDAKDHAGNPRQKGEVIDQGCFEFQDLKARARAIGSE